MRILAADQIWPLPAYVPCCYDYRGLGQLVIAFKQLSDSVIRVCVRGVIGFKEWFCPEERSYRSRQIQDICFLAKMLKKLKIKPSAPLQGPHK